MSSSNRLADVTQTPAGKVGIGALIVIALGVLGFELTHMGSGDESRVVPPKQVVSEAQQQIDAINKMTNLSPEQKKAMIAHEQGEINIAQGSAGAQPGAPGSPAPGAH